MSYNQIKNIAKLLITSLLVTLFLLFYCQAFYDFGIDAKNRILHSSLYAFFTTPLLFWASAYLCRRFAPAACGSNMDNIKSEKNLNLRTVFVCAVSSLIATFAGGSLGREGPSAQMSASIFYTISKKISWIYIGTGVGLAVAFNAPIAGFICVCEKLWQSKEKKYLSIISSSIIALFSAFLLLRRHAPVFISEPVQFHYDHEILLIILVAIICSAVAYFFKKISFHFYQKFSAIKSAKWHLVPIATGLMVSTIGAYYGIYSVGGGIKTTNDVLSNAQVFSTYGEVIGRIATTILTFISGCAGGIVAPAIAMGSGIGSLISQFFVGLNSKIFILSGMTAFLAAIIRMPITTAVIIFESVGQSATSLPFLLLAATVGALTQNLQQHSQR